MGECDAMTRIESASAWPWVMALLVVAAAACGDTQEPEPERCHSECHFEPETGRFRCEQICNKIGVD